MPLDTIGEVDTVTGVGLNVVSARTTEAGIRGIEGRDRGREAQASGREVGEAEPNIGENTHIYSRKILAAWTRSCHPAVQ